jgi:tetratricopeptide (TPR) repeat protein
LDGGALASLDADPAPEPEREPEPAAESSEPNKREGSAHSSSTRVTVSTAKQSDESLHAAQQLLHAQRFDEARTAFGKLLGEKRSRGAAAAGLAKVAFQEKKYKEAVDRAKESAKWGGGAEARVLLGDAYFKLERFDEAKKAYNEALKLDPNNRVAGQGLRLVESQQ